MVWLQVFQELRLLSSFNNTTHGNSTPTPPQPTCLPTKQTPHNTTTTPVSRNGLTPLMFDSPVISFRNRLTPGHSVSKWNDWGIILLRFRSTTRNGLTPHRN